MLATESIVDVIPIQLQSAGRSIVQGEPVRIGISLAQEQVPFCPSATVQGVSGERRTCQSRVVDRWADGSPKWILVDFHAEAAQEEYRVHFNATESPTVHTSPAMRLDESADKILVDSQAAQLAFGSGTSLLSATEHYLTDVAFNIATEQCELACKRRELEVLESGPVRSVIRQRWEFFESSDRPRLECDVEAHCFAATSLQRWTITLRNPKNAQHPGGIWDLGDPNSVLLRQATLSVRCDVDADAVRFSLQPGASRQHGQIGTWIHQASSGGENWRSSNHVDRHGEVPLPFRGFRVHDGQRETEGRRATPVVCLERDGAPLMGVAVPEFWQNFPKRIRTGASSIELELFPEEAYLHELQPGEQKSHEFWIACGDDAAEGGLLDAMRSPATPIIASEFHADSQAIPRLTPLDDEPNDGYRELIQIAVEGTNSFAAKRETVDQYGWRHYGDVWGDHEAAFSEPQPPLISHWNNQYDLVYGLGINFLRTGDARWFRLMDAMARHVRDIDIYHTDEDKSAYNHGLFWHTVHYVDAARATHRSYPAGTVGGGPCAEHAYARGLFLHYCLTGEHASRDAVIELGDWVLDMEDGRRTPFRWFSRSPTGLSSASGTPDYHGPGRGPGNACETLLTAFQASGQRKYLARVEELIHRVVHPQQDLKALNLLDAERRWYYTLFLQALGRYLEIKAELDELDDSYAYGRATLIHYATWMADHEYLYLEQPEKLEYPTETWAAQDMRKYEVFCYAADHVGGALRQRFRERAEYFFRNSVRQLIDSPTRHYCRPLALLLSNGYTHGWFSQTSPASEDPRLPRGPSLVPPRFAPFIPQKKIAKQRALALLSLSAALGISAVTIGLFYWTWH